MKLKKIKNTGNLILVRTKNWDTLASTFLRFQEYYESPKFRGKFFSLEEFTNWHTKKFNNSTYHQIWDESGFNIPSSVLKPFREGKFNPLSKKEKRFLDLLINIPEPFYIIGVYGKKIDLPTLKHEFVHGLYHNSKEYRKDVLQELKKHNLKIFTSIFKKNGYHKAVWSDETNAYLTVRVSPLFNIGFRPTSELQKTKSKLRKIFRKHFGFSLYQANKTQVLKLFQIVNI
ncbi:MAG: hypothetical protein COV30_01435 [Candidatus Yanofskybacteria bacterium CG10_big_fil_rev_8_21_14_0_10_37_15]|uniref:Uncharacterized protein n=1 Tax=Candidatus Yanofskybacteria bacterium CG10_big_fil_rev_8_21_14_0_10_37_15 TaxID=1975097 RepID=A0A2H0R670_9BACT|nr:MAG: hypothetical protein COV30_01435 [Candidatus Yanofskybacteria bacterium CG10_big_fil_rev_8_21_14_0_10_37_15]